MKTGFSVLGPDMRKNIGRVAIMLCSSLLLGGCPDGTKRIHRAAKKGDAKKVEQIIQKDPREVNVQNKLGWTPLYLASMFGRVEVVRLLLANNASIETGNILDERPLAKAAKFGHHEVAQVLLDHGANIHCVDRYGQTPLHEAAGNGKRKVVDLLLSRGADVLKKDNKNQTAGDCALAVGFKELAQYLHEKERQAGASGGEQKGGGALGSTLKLENGRYRSVSRV